MAPLLKLPIGILRQDKLEAFFETLSAIFTAIPYTLNARRDEAYFHTIFYLLLTATGEWRRPAKC